VKSVDCQLTLRMKIHTLSHKYSVTHTAGNSRLTHEMPLLDFKFGVLCALCATRLKQSDSSFLSDTHNSLRLQWTNSRAVFKIQVFGGMNTGSFSIAVLFTRSEDRKVD
jgi:hypothetical protein